MRTEPSGGLDHDVGRHTSRLLGKVVNASVGTFTTRSLLVFDDAIVVAKASGLAGAAALLKGFGAVGAAARYAGKKKLAKGAAFQGELSAAEVAGMDEANKLYLLSNIQSAHLRARLGSRQLELSLMGGAKEKIKWAMSENADRNIVPALRQSLGSRFETNLKRSA